MKGYVYAGRVRAGSEGEAWVLAASTLGIGLAARVMYAGNGWWNAYRLARFTVTKEG